MHRCKKSLAAVTIRKAKTGDFDFVFRLMTEALEPILRWRSSSSCTADFYYAYQ